MIPRLQFDEWMWLSFALASPVALWCAWPFHRAALVNLRHGATTMDTLVSVGVLAAYGWSVYALFWGHAGELGMTHDFTLTASAGEAAGQIYLEVAAGVPVFILAGRYAEARAKRRAGAAIEALLDLGAKDVSVLDADGTERRVRHRRPRRRACASSSAPARRSPPTASCSTGPRPSTSRCSPARACRSRSAPATRSSAPPSTPAAASWSRPRASAPTPPWPASAGWSSRRRPARRRCSAWPTASRPGSCPPSSPSPRQRSSAGSPPDNGAAEAFAAAVAVLIIACPCALGLATPTALHGRDRAGCAARHPHQGPRGAGVDPPGRHGGARQDRHGHHRLDAPRRRDRPTARRPGTRRCAWPARSRRRPSTRSAGPSPRARPSRPAPLPPVTGFRSHAGLGAEGVVEGHTRRCRPPRPAGRRGLAGRPTPSTTPAAGPRPTGRPRSLAGWDGRARAVLVVADQVKPTSGAAVARAAGARASIPSCSPATTPPPPARWPPRSASTGSRPRSSRPTRWPWSSRLQAEGRVVADGRRRRERRRRPGAGRPGPGHGHGHRRGHRGRPTSRW